MILITIDRQVQIGEKMLINYQNIITPNSTKRACQAMPDDQSLAHLHLSVSIPLLHDETDRQTDRQTLTCHDNVDGDGGGGRPVSPVSNVM